MVMVGQSQRLKEPLRWTRAGKLTVAAVAAIALAAAVALVIAVASRTKPLPRGCISVTFPSNVGGATVQTCGARARSDCAEPEHSSLQTARLALEEACDRAKLPFAVGS
ncbi:MAG: hypothetical protein ACYCU0_02000 [Solirubrobacteraceae bacterium]